MARFDGSNGTGGWDITYEITGECLPFQVSCVSQSPAWIGSDRLDPVPPMTKKGVKKIRPSAAIYCAGNDPGEHESV